jgi:hypothetical protein
MKFHKKIKILRTEDSEFQKMPESPVQAEKKIIIFIYS